MCVMYKITKVKDMCGPRERLAVDLHNLRDITSQISQKDKIQFFILTDLSTYVTKVWQA